MERPSGENATDQIARPRPTSRAQDAPVATSRTRMVLSSLAKISSLPSGVNRMTRISAVWPWCRARDKGPPPPLLRRLRALLKTREEIAPMTTFLAYAALAIILLLAFAAEELKPCAEK